MTKYPLGHDAIVQKGYLGAHKWLILRRISQFSILALFLIGPLFDLWVVKGNLNSSLTLDILPLTDPYVLLQSWLSGHTITSTALIGAMIVAAFYFLIGGRVYCSWVCPVNVITDAASWLRRRLGIKSNIILARSMRYWLLLATLIVSTITGTIIWEFVNPVSLLHRGIIFGMGLGWIIILSVFLFDLILSQRGWCGHICPVGAFYSVLGHASLPRISADKREQCTNCMECVVVCPEPQILPPVLKTGKDQIHPMIFDSVCTNCGRCIDICAEDVLHFRLRKIPGDKESSALTTKNIQK
jgi:ferredoxin-type protein NapH